MVTCLRRAELQREEVRVVRARVTNPRRGLELGATSNRELCVRKSRFNESYAENMYYTQRVIPIKTGLYRE